MTFLADAEWGMAMGAMLLLAGIIVASAIGEVFANRKERPIINLWIAAQGYERVYVERIKPPSTECWPTAKGYEFYSLKVRKEGAVHHGWMRCPKDEEADAGDCDVIWLEIIPQTDADDSGNP